MTDYQISEATRFYDAMIDMAKEQSQAKVMAREEFLKEPSIPVMRAHMNLGDGPDDDELIAFVIMRANQGDLIAKMIISRVADKVFLFAEVPD